MNAKFMKVVLGWLGMIATAKRYLASLFLSANPITVVIAVVILLLGVGEVMSYYGWKSLKLVSILEVEAGDRPNPAPPVRDNTKPIAELLRKY